MRKNMEIDVPKDADTEVQRVRGLKKSIFTRTRIATLSLVLVLALSVSSTLAFEKWTGNQTPNRVNNGDVDIHIVEEVNGAAVAADNGRSDVSFGYGNKKVKIKRGDLQLVNEYPDKVRVSFIPELQKSVKDPNAAADATSVETKLVSVPFSEEWTTTAPAGIQSGTRIVSTDADGNVTESVADQKYIRYGDLVLWLNNAEVGNWSYSDGAFTYIKSDDGDAYLSRGEETGFLLMGVDWADKVQGLTCSLSDTEKESYKVKLNVIADAIQASALDADDEAVDAAWS